MLSLMWLVDLVEQCALSANAAPKDPMSGQCPFLSCTQRTATTCGVQVGVEKVTLNGRIRLTMKPLMGDMPIVAAIQVSHTCGLQSCHAVRSWFKAQNTSWQREHSHKGGDCPDVSRAPLTIMHAACAPTIQQWELLCRICTAHHGCPVVLYLWRPV